MEYICVYLSGSSPFKVSDQIFFCIMKVGSSTARLHMSSKMSWLQSLITCLLLFSTQRRKFLNQISSYLFPSYTEILFCFGCIFSSETIHKSTTLNKIIYLLQIQLFLPKNFMQNKTTYCLLRDNTTSVGVKYLYHSCF